MNRLKSIENIYLETVVFEQGEEDLVLANESQTSLETSNREAAKRRNLPLTKVSPPADQPTQEEVGHLMPVHSTVPMGSRYIVL